MSAPSFRSKKIFSQYPIPIVPAASLLFTLFPSPSRMTAFWSLAHDFDHVFRGVHAPCTCERGCAFRVQGAILISIQSRTISPAQPLKDEKNEGSFRNPFPARPWRRQVGQVLRFSNVRLEVLGKLCKPWWFPHITANDRDAKEWREKIAMGIANNENRTLHQTSTFGVSHLLQKSHELRRFIKFKGKWIIL